MKLRFNKTQTSETEVDKIIKASFAGSLNGIMYALTVQGDEEGMQKIMQELKLKRYGQMIDLDLTNTQTTVEEFEK